MNVGMDQPALETPLTLQPGHPPRDESGRVVLKNNSLNALMNQRENGSKCEQQRRQTVRKWCCASAIPIDEVR